MRREPAPARSQPLPAFDPRSPESLSVAALPEPYKTEHLSRSKPILPGKSFYPQTLHVTCSTVVVHAGMCSPTTHRFTDDPTRHGRVVQLGLNPAASFLHRQVPTEMGRTDYFPESFRIDGRRCSMGGIRVERSSP